MARSRAEPARAVEQARIVWLAHPDARVLTIAREAGVSEANVRLWLTRFSARGLDGLADAPRGPAADVHRRGRSARWSPPT